MASQPTLVRARRLLCELQDSIRDAVIASHRKPRRSLQRIAKVTAADTIYGIDEVTEEVVLHWFNTRWPRECPVELVMEGLDEGTTTFPAGTPAARTEWKCILDPIDGTRSLMYDKRSGWSLAGLARQRGAQTTTADIVVAAMTELPTSKSAAADQLSAVKGEGIVSRRLDLRSGKWSRLATAPSRATGVAHGFASFAKFFPTDKAWLAGLEENLWRELGAGPAIFDDQYLSTGGQLYELIVGHDRFVADLRPLAPNATGALCCHPYDICTALIAREAGCLIESPDGKALRVPLDTTTPVAWVGYANRKLARKIGPRLRRVLQM